MQRKLAHKENSKENTGLHKLPGFKNGVIYTSEDVMAILAKDAEVREAQEAEAEQNRANKTLKDEAEKWLKDAQEAQEEEHAR
jgi:hypothetical protein